MQVGIVYEGMKFPLWLHSHVVVMFLVQSVSPIKAIGKTKSFYYLVFFKNNLKENNFTDFLQKINTVLIVCYFDFIK